MSKSKKVPTFVVVVIQGKNGRESFAYSEKAGKGYKGHRLGSQKEELHKIFDKYGRTNLKRAKEEASKRGAAPGTISTAFSQFRNTSRAGDMT